MSMATRRLKQLEKKFRGSTLARKLTTAQRHDLCWAAALQQVAEVMVAEMILGAKHDRQSVEHLKAEVRQHLVLAGVQFNQEK